MFELFILFVLLLFNLDTSLCQDNPNSIILNIINRKQNGLSYLACQSSETYTLLEQDPAEVIVNYNKTINEARCYYTYNNGISYTDVNLRKSGTRTRLRVIQTRAGEWTCEFLTLRDIGIIEPIVIRNNIKYTQVKCKFNVRVRLINGPNITINTVPVETKRQDELTSEYDYLGHYYFQPGLPVNIECFRPKQNAGSLQLTLTSARDGYIFMNVTHEYMDRRIFIKLTEEHNNSYLDCTYSTSNNDLFLRIFMYINDRVIPAEDSLIIKINAEPLKSNPILVQDTANKITVNHLFYDLTYSADEEVKVTCEKYEDSTRELKLTLDMIDGNYIDPKPTTNGIVYKDIKTRKLNNDSRITCSLKTDRGNFTDYVIRFIRRWAKNGLLLNGLSSKNILLDYAKSNGYVHEIRYLYKFNDTLNLTCRCSTVNCKVSWTVDDDITSIINMDEVAITLDGSNNNSAVKCSNVDRNYETTVIYFVYQNQSISDDFTTTYNTDAIENNNEPKNNKPKHMKLIVSGISTCLFIVLLVLLICCWRNNRVKKLQTQPQGIDYETLQSHNEASNHLNNCNIYSRPVDEVNDSQYSVPYKADLNDLYAKPIPKSERTGQEGGASDIYAEINKTDKVSNPNDIVTYAELSFAKAKDIYAEVIPKSKRNNPPNDVPESNYAEFYAEAVPVSQSHYGNVSDNQRYVNNDGSDDYAEPAYCELLVKRKMK